MAKPIPGTRVQGPTSGQPPADPPKHHLVLAGGGHTHALVLRMWAMGRMRPPAATLITLVNRHSTCLYSGLVPALVAGVINRDGAAIDLRRLCDQAGVTFVRAEISGLDRQRRELRLVDRPALRFDRLSLDVGAITASTGSSDGNGTGISTGNAKPIAVKPLEPFLAYASQLGPEERIRIRGGGAAAVELALAFRSRGLATELVVRGAELDLGSAAANAAGLRLLCRAGIGVLFHAPADAASDLACTGSQAPHWLAAAGLPVDPTSGRVLTERSLAVIDDPILFASGDCGLIAKTPRAPSGVWAVRAAPVLAVNLARSLGESQRRLQTWRPQRRALQLLGDGGGATGQPQALALWGALALGPHPWLWHGKQWIDRRFMAGFSALAPMADPELAKETMACRGCAAKLAQAPLAAALARLEPDGVTPPPQDAAVVGASADGSLQLQSIDGFPALVPDPWLNARLTTLHACSDLWASGAQVATVQALVTLPVASPNLQEELLLQTLAGIRSVLDPLAAQLIGGHTLEGRDGGGLSLALTVNGRVAHGQPWGKGPLLPGDVLLLSRPLGSGVLFAAAAAGAAHPTWIDGALEELQRSQAALVEVLRAAGCRACTDITGFGLLGHLGEMVAAGGRVELDTGAVPAFAGALELLEQGYASSLAPANARSLGLLDGPLVLRQQDGSGAHAARLALLIDPQTCGPLLAAVPPDQAEPALKALHNAGFNQAAQIGLVLPTPTP